MSKKQRIICDSYAVPLHGLTAKQNNILSQSDQNVQNDFLLNFRLPKSPARCLNLLLSYLLISLKDDLLSEPKALKFGDGFVDYIPSNCFWSCLFWYLSLYEVLLQV